MVDDTNRRATRSAVGWLLGPELIAHLRQILRKRSDPREWMPYFRGAVHDECWRRDGALVHVADPTPKDPQPDPPTSAEKVAPPKSKEEAKAGIGAENATKPVWFDYLADMGDATDSMYAVAYATMASFQPEDAADLKLGTTDVTPRTWSPRTPRPKHGFVLRPGPTGTLERGAFLVFGGDAAYHVADAATLKARVRDPFRWAFGDAKRHLVLSENASDGDDSRRLYGIPGNHDWYDNLRGFSRVFRVGRSTALEPGEDDQELISLPQYKRVQLASYMGIQLPFGWQIWGLDIDSPVDARQRDYFQSLADGHPERLIVATPSPAIAFDRYNANEHHDAVIKKLGIEVPELPITLGNRPAQQARLDISGDVHQYARYYPTAGIETYGSVISGLGGAFHHPTFTSVRPPVVEAQQRFPEIPDSMASVAKGLLTPVAAWFSSWLRGVPLLLGILFGFACTSSVGASWLIERVLRWLHLPIATTHGTSHELVSAICCTGIVVLAIGGVVGGIQFGRLVFKKQVKKSSLQRNVVDVYFSDGFTLPRLLRLFDPTRLAQALEPYRSYWLAWLFAILGLGAFASYPHWGRWGRVSGTPGLDVTALLMFVGLPITGAAVAAFYGGKVCDPIGKLGLAVLGLVHMAVQVIGPILIVQLLWTGLPGVCAYIAVFACLWALLALARTPFSKPGRGHGWAVVLCAALAVAAFIAIPLAVTNATPAVFSQRWSIKVLRIVCSGLAAMPFGTIWFTWYLAVAARFDGHNNEVGGAARVTAYRQIIRFHVHEKGLTGYVIAISAKNGAKRVAERARDADLSQLPLEFRLIDVFTVETPEEFRAGPVAIPVDASNMDLLRAKPPGDDV